MAAKRSPEQQWCDGVVALASQLHGSRTEIAEALLASVFFRMAETRGLLPDESSFEKRYQWLVARGGDASMLPALTPPFAEIPLDDEGTHHVELLGHLHGLLMAPEERRGRGSHYTPREMAAEIVMHTLDPLVLPADENEVTPKLGDTIPPGLHVHGVRPDKPTAAEIASLKVCDSAMGGGVFLVECIRYLGDALHKAMAREGKEMSLHDCRIAVALRCIYGVDKDPTACWLAQCVVWLFLEDPALSRYALLYALRTGDALVGLDSEQLCAFHWERGQPAIPEIVQHITPLMETARHLRQTFRSCRLLDEDALELNSKIDTALHDVRFIGDLCVGAFFACDKPKTREAERQRRLELVLWWLQSGSDKTLEELDTLQKAMNDKHVPFHWWAEFPEAFLWRNASLTTQPTEQPLVVSADAHMVKAVENAHGQMGWSL